MLCRGLLEENFDSIPTIAMAQINVGGHMAQKETMSRCRAAVRSSRAGRYEGT